MTMARMSDLEIRRGEQGIKPIRRPATWHCRRCGFEADWSDTPALTAHTRSDCELPYHGCRECDREVPAFDRYCADCFAQQCVSCDAIDPEGAIRDGEWFCRDCLGPKHEGRIP